MSKRFLTSSSSNPDSAFATSKEQKEKDQVSVLYELGLLSSSDKGTRRREKDKGRELPGGARIAGSHSKKSTQQPSPILTFPLLHPSAEWNQ
jgi:hypothetical protein